MGHYEFGEHADVYTQLMFTDYESVAQIAPGGNFFDTNSVNCDNPLLPVGILPTIGCDAAAIAAGSSVAMYIGRRNVEGGGRQDGVRELRASGPWLACAAPSTKSGVTTCRRSIPPRLPTIRLSTSSGKIA